MRPRVPSFSVKARASCSGKIVEAEQREGAVGQEGGELAPIGLGDHAARSRAQQQIARLR